MAKEELDSIAGWSFGHDLGIRLLFTTYQGLALNFQSQIQGKGIITSYWKYADHSQ